MKTITLFSFLFIILAWGVKAQETQYQRPPAEIEEVVLAKLSPVSMISPDNRWMLQLERSPFRTVAQLAQPELKLAGVRINPATFGGSRQTEYTGVSVMDIAKSQSVEVTGLPENGVIVRASFSPNAKQVVLAVEQTDGIYLYSFAPEQPVADKMSDRKVNGTRGIDIRWLNDDTFLTLLVPENVGNVPERNPVPSGPIIQESTGKRMAARTYQDLLSNEYDEQLFEYYFTSQLVKVESGRITPVATPAIYSRVSLSPDKKLILQSTIQKPYSYQVPMYNFPQTYTVVDLDGKLVQKLVETPVLILPMGYDVASPYPRSYGWRTDKAATLYWVEAQDKGNPRENKVEFMDIVYQWEYPFDAPKQELAKTQTRFAGIEWGDERFALLYEYSRETRKIKTWQFAPATPGMASLVFDVSSDDEYNNPGNPVTVRNQYNLDVLYTNKAQTELLMVSQGASPEGNMPYISRYDLKTKKKTILWRCEAPYYESIVKVTDPNKLQLITSRQSLTEPANFYIRDLKKKRATQLTHYPNPYPLMEGVSKEKINYKRADGLNLTATVYLPAGYDKEKDGRLPVLMWAYPREYRSAADASQVRGSKYTFTNINYGSPVFWVLRGYCVMDNVEMPIVGSEGEEPNDTFVEQLAMNAEAAINAIHEMGVGDTARVAVGGHSYGAFMTANLMAHTKYFKAGIARSGAYNRTLTPFGFQAETRTYWEAPEVYYTMSPFMYADSLNGAILLIHGEMDNNSGTFPIQSDRFFQALKGHGAISRYVVLPYESHGYAAKENILHMLYETDAWLEKHVK